MRRIFAVLILILIATMAVMIVWDVPRNMFLSFLTTVAGPTIVNTGVTAVNGILSMIGLHGFAAIMLIGGLAAGIVVHSLWVKMDWSIRRWGSIRTAKDLGASGVVSMPSTPATATVRPTTTVTQPTQDAAAVEQAAKTLEEQK